MNNDQNVNISSQDTSAAISGDYNIFEAYIRGLANELEHSPSSHNTLNEITTDEKPFTPMCQLPVPKTQTLI